MSLASHLATVYHCLLHSLPSLKTSVHSPCGDEQFIPSSRLNKPSSSSVAMTLGHTYSRTIEPTTCLTTALSSLPAWAAMIQVKQPPLSIYPLVFPVPHHELHHSLTPHWFCQCTRSCTHFLNQPGENTSGGFRFSWENAQANQVILTCLCSEDDYVGSCASWVEEQPLANRWVHPGPLEILTPLQVQLQMDVWHSIRYLGLTTHRLRFLCLIKFFSWCFGRSFQVFSRVVLVDSNIYTAAWTFHIYCSYLQAKCYKDQ